MTDKTALPSTTRPGGVPKTFYVTAETRTKIKDTAAAASTTMSAVVAAALDFMRSLPAVPEIRPLSGRQADSITVSVTTETADWLGGLVIPGRVSLGAALTTALQTWIDAGSPGLPAKPKGRRGAEPPKPRQKAASLISPRGTVSPTDRAVCPGCASMRRVETGPDGVPVMSSHIVWRPDDTHTRGGEHLECPGAGQVPGRVIHAAQVR